MPFIMGYIVPEPVERYLSGLNSARDTVLDQIARDGESLAIGAEPHKSCPQKPRFERSQQLPLGLQLPQQNLGARLF